jgi:hypothetical protein
MGSLKGFGDGRVDLGAALLARRQLVLAVVPLVEQ